MEKKMLHAFPLLSAFTPDGDTLEAGYNGMTLRDYFAAKAMQTLINDSQQELGEWWECTGDEANQNLPTDILLAVTSYMIADAMMHARSRPNAQL